MQHSRSCVMRWVRQTAGSTGSTTGRRRTLRMLRGSVVVWALVACGGPSAGSDSSSPDVSGEGQRFVDAIEGAPTECAMAAVVKGLSRFFAAVNDGEPHLADGFFSDGTTVPFHWFSFDDFDPENRRSFSTFTPDSVDAYLASRHAAGERWVLRGGKFIGYMASRATVAFSPVMFDYYVPDSSKGGSMRHGFGIGKGEYHCGSGLFAVMSLSASSDSTQWLQLWTLLGASSSR